MSASAWDRAVADQMCDNGGSEAGRRSNVTRLLTRSLDWNEEGLAMNATSAHALFGDERLPCRFWAKVTVEPDTGCWQWTGGRGSDGYGFFRDDRWSTRKAHRVAYLALVAEIAPGLVIDHLCRVRHCVNPAHMEPVTNQENIRRGVASEVAAARQRAKTHCPHGHEYTPENTVIKSAGGRRCRICQRRDWERSDWRRRNGQIATRARRHTANVTANRIRDALDRWGEHFGYEERASAERVIARLDAIGNGEA